MALVREARSEVITVLAMSDATQPAASMTGVAFQVFLRDENHRLLAFVRRRVSSEADAHDIVQQALMQAFVALRDFRGDSLLSTWIFGIASRLVMGHYRGRPRAVLPDDGAVDALPGLEGATDPFHEVVLIQRLAIIHRVLAALPSGQHSAWTGVVEHGRSCADVARQLDVPVGTVRSRVSRVRAAIRQAMEEAEHGPPGG
jgi:RNA polymerase sigma factor (sigma-70 family)